MSEIVLKDQRLNIRMIAEKLSTNKEFLQLENICSSSVEGLREKKQTCLQIASYVLKHELSSMAPINALGDSNISKNDKSTKS